MLENYRNVKETTKCPFAKGAKVIEIPLDNGSIDDIARNLRTELPTLTPKRLDAAVVPLPKDYTKTSEDVGRGLYDILQAVDTTSVEEVEENGWKLRLYGEKFFIGTFWEGFDETSPRKCPEGGFLIFQPKSSFDRQFRGPLHEERIRTNIRSKFKKDGRPYDHTKLSEAQRFLPEVIWYPKAGI